MLPAILAYYLVKIEVHRSRSRRRRVQNNNMSGSNGNNLAGIFPTRSRLLEVADCVSKDAGLISMECIRMHLDSVIILFVARPSGL